MESDDTPLSDAEQAAFLDEQDGEVLADLDEGDEPPADSDMDDEAEGGTDVQTGAVADDAAQCLRAHTAPVYAVVGFGGEQQVFASGGGDDRAFLWRVSRDGGFLPTPLNGHTDSVAALQFSADGSRLATGGLDGKINVWDTMGNLLHCLEGPGGGIEWMHWHPRGHVLLAGSEDFTAWLWNAADGSCMQVFSGHNGAVSCGAFTPDGRTVCTASADGSLRQWSPKTGECSLTMQGFPFHEGPVTSLCVHPTGGTVMTGSEDATARLTSLVTGKVLGTLTGHTASVETVGFCDALPYAATGSVDTHVLLWDLTSLTIRQTCAHGAAVTALKWVPSTSNFFSAACDGVLRLWDGRTGSCVRTWTGHTDAILDMWVAPDGKTVCTGSEDGTVRVFLA